LSTASRGAELNLVHGGAVDPADIIFGCGPIVTDRSGPIELTQVDAAVHAALEAGVVHFDTAPLYGDSEDRLGHALAASPLGSSAVVMTKAGKVIRRLCPLRHVASLGPEPWTPFAIPLEERCLLPDYTAAGARKSYTESCQRMGLSSLHTLRIHDADSIEGAFAAATAPDGLIAGLMQLKAEGAIQHVSLGMNANIDHKVVTPGTGGLETTAWQPDDILRVIRASPEGCFDSALLAYSWSLGALLLVGSKGTESNAACLSSPGGELHLRVESACPHYSHHQLLGKPLHLPHAGYTHHWLRGHQLLCFHNRFASLRVREPAKCIQRESEAHNVVIGCDHAQHSTSQFFNRCAGQTSVAGALLRC
jgi:hypothetical protein